MCIRDSYDIDYDSSIVTEITMNNANNYLQTTRYMTEFGANNFFLGDYYLVVRNDSGSSNINANAAV